MNQQPGRFTRPLGGEYGDTFTSTSQGRGYPKYTQPLNQSPEALKTAVSKRVMEINHELPGIREIVALFTPYVRVLELAEGLQAFSPREIEEALIEPDPSLEDWTEPSGLEEPSSQDNTDPELEPSDSLEENYQEPENVVVELTGPRKLFWDYNLSPERQALALKICERIRKLPQLKQRVQITIHQFNDTAASYQQACQILNQVFESTPAEGWALLEKIAIERLKGKAYSTNGFYDHFKGDPVLGELFPPPNLSPMQYTPSFSAERSPAPVTAPLQEPPPAKKGLLGNLKGIFGKNS